MDQRETDVKPNYNLFDQEEKVLAQTEEMVGRLQEVAQGVEVLAEAYRKQYHEQQRMVRLSDRMQLELHQANQRFQEQAEELRSLNQSLTREIERRQKLEEELRNLAVTDSLTGLFTRRHLLEMGAREAIRAARNGSPLSLVIIDLDHFKTVNDRYGHAAGDRALQVFAQICRENLRETDVLGRIGGEEFAVVLPDSDTELAREAAERVRLCLAQREIDHQGHTFSLQASFGVAACAADAKGLQQALSHADKALYQAKAQGRNRTVIWQEDPASPAPESS